MDTQKLTLKTLKSFKPTQILYAEYAEPGAMGVAGSARFYVQKSKNISYHLIETVPDDSHTNPAADADLEVYLAAIKFLKSAVKSRALIETDGRYGNHAYKQKSIPLARDDDAHAFLYNGQPLKASCPGVYFTAAPKFAPRNPSLKTLEKYLNSHSDDFSMFEFAFFQSYLGYFAYLDENGFDPAVSPEDYYNAVDFLRFRNLELFNFSDARIADGVRAAEKYVLARCLSELGYNAIHELFTNLYNDKATDLGPRLESLAGTKSIISQVHIPSDFSSLAPGDDDYIANIFSAHPFLVDFTPEARQKIASEIMSFDAGALRAYSRAIAFYFANYLFHDDTWAYADILPAAVHFIENAPFDDRPRTANTATAFWLAGEIIDEAWKCLEEDDEKQKQFRDLVYDTYWPRIGGLWPIQHYNLYEFRDPSAAKMFDDALSFVMSLEDFPDRNPEVADYLKFIGDSTYHPSYLVERRAFTMTLSSLTSKEQFEKILDRIKPARYHEFFSFLETIEDADILLAELFRTDDARLTGLTRIGIFEQLFLCPNSIGVGEHLYSYLDKHFEEYAKIVSADCTAEGLDFPEVFASFITASSRGISEENEFPPLKSLAEKTKNLLAALLISPDAPETPSDAAQNRYAHFTREIDASLKAARKRRRTIFFQRAALKKLF